MRRLYITTATGALSSEQAPAGGGVAVLEALIPRLAERGDWSIRVLRPQAMPNAFTTDGVTYVDLAVPILRDTTPDALIHFGERRYARFALQWGAALEAYFQAVEPHGAVVLANDVSEGPPFAWLAQRGFRQVVLYHVVVADFFARQYLSGRYGVRLSSPAAARLWRWADRLGLGRLAPDIARLVWSKEGESARFADRCIVPSRQLGDALAACYPGSGVERRLALAPWGVIGPDDLGDPARRASRDATLRGYDIDPGRFVLLTLSRLSPEKQVERVVAALQRIERDDPARADGLALVVAGAPAYMGGDRYEERLRRQAAQLHRVQVRFPGYVAGEAKWALLAAADLFCSPSHYEAYGLTIAQALASGTPVLAAPHQGGQATVEADRGWLVNPQPAVLAGAIAHAQDSDLSSLRAAATDWGRAHPFSDAAASIADALESL